MPCVPEQRKSRNKKTARILTALAAPLLSTCLYAQQAIDIPAQPLADALRTLGQQSGLQIIYNADLVQSKQSNAISGEHSAESALAKLLQGNGLTFSIQGNTATLISAGQDLNGVTRLETLVIDGQSTPRFGLAPEEPGGFKAEYQTTATKLAMPIKETPQAISVVTKDNLEARQANDLATALELTSGVSSSANGSGIGVGPGMFGGDGFYGQKFTLRGQYSPVLNDGFTIGTSQDIDLAAYERIETIKGPSGFYGSGYLGGFINRVRKKPEADQYTELSLQAGSFDTYRTALDTTGALSSDENILGRMIIAYEDSGSFVNEVDSENLMIAPSLEAIIDDRTRVLVQPLYQKKRYNANPGVPLQLEGNQVTTFDDWDTRDTLYGQVGAPSTNELLELSITLDHEINKDWNASLLLYGANSQRDAIDYGVWIEPDILYFSGTTDKRSTDLWSSEAKLTGHFKALGSSHDVVFGVIHQKESSRRQYGIYDSIVGSYGTTSLNDVRIASIPSKHEVPDMVDRTTDYSTNSAYAQMKLNLTDRTNLLSAIRYDEIDTSVTSNPTIYSSSTSIITSGDTELTWRVGLTHSINEAHSLYTTYAQSFSPTLAEGRNGILDPNTGEGYEIGLKSEWFDKKLGSTISIYRQDLNNIPITDPNNGPGESYSISSGLNRTNGLEIEVNGSPLPGLTIGAAAHWLDNEYIEENDSNYGLTTDGTTDEQYSVYANYEIGDGILKGLGIGGTIVKVGERQFIASGSQVYLDGYHRADLNLSYNGLPNWDLSLLVRNVTDEEYIESASSAYYVRNYWGSPRAALLKASYRF